MKPATDVALALAPVAAPTALGAKPTSKSDTMIRLSLRAKGATLTELIAATDGQPHSLRAFLSGLRKKGQTIVRGERNGGGFAYRIVMAATDAANDYANSAGKPVAEAGGGANPAPIDFSVANDGQVADSANTRKNTEEVLERAFNITTSSPDSETLCRCRSAVGNNENCRKTLHSKLS